MSAALFMLSATVTVQSFVNSSPRSHSRSCVHSRHTSQLRRKSGLAEIMSQYKFGPAEVTSGPARQAVYLLHENPELFDSVVESEFDKLQVQKLGVEQDLTDSSPQDQDAIVLRRRVKEVRESERAHIATELIYLQVCNYFRKLRVEMIPPLKKGGDVKLERSGENIALYAFTDMYSADALALVKEHLFGILGPHSSFMAPKAIVQISLYQAAQAYAMSALVGYYLRRVDARHQLEKLAGSLGSLGEDVPATINGKEISVNDEETVNSLTSYIQSFGPEELQRMTTVASAEAQMAMETQVMALFGDVRRLKESLVDAVGSVLSNEEATMQLQRAITEQRVESIRIDSDDIRRVILEGVAFGSILHESEKNADSFYELTPSVNRRMGFLTGDDDTDGTRLLQ